ncbi:serine hydrolase domain-containing protein [Aerolutibacter ruishenii]|nr:serine hydrolase domain-containing protein [Lysobacter ruishenii]
MKWPAAALLVLVGFDAGAAIPTAEAEQLVREFTKASGAPGLSVSVGRCDRIVWSEGFGFADVEQRVPVAPAVTRFRIGSVAKPMTALALTTLIARGRIDLDADVRRYVPTFPRKEHDFSVRQLAGHLAGIRHYAGDEAYSRTHYASVGDALAIFKDDPLVAPPGKEWRYSSYGYNLLAAVIEQASNKAFLDHMAESVFVPLGMADTEADHIGQIVPHRGRYYVRREGKLLNEPEVDNSNKWASGGILSTTDDLVRFGLAHFDDRLVSPDMRNILWTEQRTSAGANTGYGIGWRTVVDAEGNRWIGHGGGSIGGTTQFWLFPDQQLVIAVASNMTELDYGDLLPRLRNLFTDSPAIRTGCSRPKVG